MLSSIILTVFGLHNDQSGIDAFHHGNQLISRDWFGLGLAHHPEGRLIRLLGVSWGGELRCLIGWGFGAGGRLGIELVPELGDGGTWVGLKEVVLGVWCRGDRVYIEWISTSHRAVHSAHR